MNAKTLIVSAAAFVMAVVLAVIVAIVAVNTIERRTERSLSRAFAEQGLTWVQIAPDGLQATLSGTAPDESARIRALRVAGSVIDSARINETIEVPISGTVVAPVFRIEVMRNRDTLSVIGLVPQANDTGPIVERLREALPGTEISDMLQSSDHAVPGGWVAAVDFAIRALAEFEVGRISVTAGRIEVEAQVPSAEAARALETRLRELAPRGQVLTLDLTAPRPVAAPFLLRVDLADGTFRVGACSADTEEARARIAAALEAAGSQRRLACALALGAPSPRWGEAAALAIGALSQLEAGELTLSDGDVSLVVPHTVPEARFDRVVGRLEQTLPDAFTLTARRLDPPQAETADENRRPEMVMELSEEGHLSLVGRLPDSRIRDAVGAFARARFGAQSVEMAARVDATLPQGWSIRVLTALEALSELHHGRAVVREDLIRVSGVSGNPDVTSQVTQALVQGIGSEGGFQIDVTYDEALDPVQQTPTPDDCEARIRSILAEDKITFDPGSTEINEAAGRVIDRIATVLQECGEMPFEVAGHTDSQGREETNLRLSQARAEAVINALLARRVLVGSMVARGYGDAHPIADNGTEEGREANRRIEFTLIRPEPEPEPIDPALEAQLEFEIQTPTGDDTRPRARPPLPDTPAAPAEDAPQD
ncbi:MAG: OmpA family protein [Pararhodobacter sp.]